MKTGNWKQHLNVIWAFCILCWGGYCDWFTLHKLEPRLIDFAPKWTVRLCSSNQEFYPRNIAWPCHSVLLLCFDPQTVRSGGNWKVQFSLVWLTQTVRRIQAVSVFVWKCIISALSGERYFQSCSKVYICSQWLVLKFGCTQFISSWATHQNFRDSFFANHARHLRD